MGCCSRPYFAKAAATNDEDHRRASRFEAKLATETAASASSSSSVDAIKEIAELQQHNVLLPGETTTRVVFERDTPCTELESVGVAELGDSQIETPLDNSDSSEHECVATSVKRKRLPRNRHVKPVPLRLPRRPHRRPHDAYYMRVSQAFSCRAGQRSNPDFIRVCCLLPIVLLCQARHERASGDHPDALSELRAFTIALRRNAKARMRGHRFAVAIQWSPTPTLTEEAQEAAFAERITEFLANRISKWQTSDPDKAAQLERDFAWNFGCTVDDVRHRSAAALAKLLLLPNDGLSELEWLGRYSATVRQLLLNAGVEPNPGPPKQPQRRSRGEKKAQDAQKRPPNSATAKKNASKAEQKKQNEEEDTKLTISPYVSRMPAYNVHSSDIADIVQEVDTALAKTFTHAENLVFVLMRCL